MFGTVGSKYGTSVAFPRAAHELDKNDVPQGGGVADGLQTDGGIGLVEHGDGPGGGRYPLLGWLFS